MGMTIFYPANAAEWYAKGTAENNVYFEVPAIFKNDGTCDEAATQQKVQQFLQAISVSAQEA